MAKKNKSKKQFGKASQESMQKQQNAEVDDAVLLEHMRLHGFWPYDQGKPTETPEQLAERLQLQEDMVNLLKKAMPKKDLKRDLEQERKRRWEESKARRQARRAELLKLKQLRREKWEENKKDKIVYAGEFVSAGLNDSQSNVERLNQNELPVVHNALDLAARLALPLRVLRWLTFHRRGTAVVHYHRYSIAKVTGGVRNISAPKPALAHCQRWILDNILAKLPVDECVHGFCPNRSIRSNAVNHVGKPIVINMDIQDFFPTITFRRVKGLFHKLGYSEQIATLLSLLTTEPPRVGVEVDGKVSYVALGERVLPQGACTSPAITNFLCCRMDRRLAGLARKHGFAYTRYADDLTFSGEQEARIGRLLRSVRSILGVEGFAEHPSKTKVMRRSQRQEVTGVIVNDRPTISRREVRQLRAVLHNIAKNGWESQNRDNHPDFVNHVRGRVEFIAMIDPEKGIALRRRLHEILNR